jgi:hypothetical protein
LLHIFSNVINEAVNGLAPYIVNYAVNTKAWIYLKFFTTMRGIEWNDIK